MTCPALQFILPALALVFASCAGTPKEPPASTQVKSPSASPPQAEYKKPVRMNGRGAISSISLSEFFALQESGKAMVFDARPAFFYHLGHVPGAINLSKSHCDEQIAAREPEIKSALAGGKNLIVYCSSSTCPDARTVAIHLSGFGYPARIFSGGWAEWKEAEMPGE